MKKLLVMLLAVGMLAAVTTGCGSGSSDSESGTTGSEGSTSTASTGQINVHAPLQCDAKLSVQEMLDYQVPKANENYNITLMEVSLGAYYFQAMAFGAQKAADEAGVNLTIKASQGYQSASQQVDQAQTVIAQNPDAIVLQPADIEGSVPIVDQATSAGIPVVDISTEVNSDDAMVVMQDDYEQGKMAADALAKKLPGGGTGIVQGGPSNATWSKKRVAGFKDQLSAKYPDLKILTVTNEGVDPEEGLRKFTDATQAHPKFDWIYAVNTALLLPDSIPAQYSKVPYIGGGLEPMVIDALANNKMFAAIPADQVAMGYFGVGRAIAKLNGDDPPRVTCMPVDAVTKDDLKTPFVEGELYPEDYKAG